MERLQSSARRWAFPPASLAPIAVGRCRWSRPRRPLLPIHCRSAALASLVAFAMALPCHLVGRLRALGPVLLGTALPMERVRVLQTFPCLLPGSRRSSHLRPPSPGVDCSSPFVCSRSPSRCVRFPVLPRLPWSEGAGDVFGGVRLACFTRRRCKCSCGAPHHGRSGDPFLPPIPPRVPA